MTGGQEPAGPSPGDPSTPDAGGVELANVDHAELAAGYPGQGSVAPTTRVHKRGNRLQRDRFRDVSIARVLTSRKPRGRVRFLRWCIAHRP
jgi:hypothetical protein